MEDGTQTPRAPRLAGPASEPRSRLAFWRAGFGLAALVACAVTGIGLWLWFDELRRVEEHNRVAEALGSLRCVSRLVDRYRDSHGRLPRGSFEEVLAAVAPASRPRTDLLYQSLTTNDASFEHFFTHSQAKDGPCSDAEIGRFRHEAVGLIDPFGKPYQFVREVASGYTTGLVLSHRKGYVLNAPSASRCAYLLVSNGLDRRYGTEDDIRVTSETPRDIKQIAPTLARPFED